MRRITKLGLGIATLAIGVLALSGCTSSFCSTTDSAHIASAYDNGVTKYYDSVAEAVSDGAKESEVYLLSTIDGISDVYLHYSYAHNNGGITKANEKAKSLNIAYSASNCEYWASLDLVILEKSYEAYKTEGNAQTITGKAGVESLLDKYSYLRFDSNDKTTNKLWDNWSIYDQAARENMISKYAVYGITYNIDKIPTTDFINIYQQNISTTITNYRGCITVNEQKYGNYGWENNKTEVTIQAKDYGYGWSKGFFEGLLVFPIAALIDVMCQSFAPMGTGLNGTNGWAQLVTILLVTLIVRAFMFVVSFKSTISNARMSEIQPEITKIQNKYPEARTNNYQKQNLANDMNKLYKKHHINPFSSIIVMIVQFPLFICVWGAFIGSAWLSTGSFLGMNFSDSISGILFNGANWGNGSAWTALVLFLLMSGAQVVAMLLPQWYQKKRSKNVAKLGKNPAQNQQNKTMKIVTYVMMAMIIFMGFSLASAMGVYWFVGALISILQTIITQAIIERQRR